MNEAVGISVEVSEVENDSNDTTSVVVTESSNQSVITDEGDMQMDEQTGGTNRLEEAELIINLQTSSSLIGRRPVPVALQKAMPSQLRPEGPKVDEPPEVIIIERKKSHECYICKETFKSFTQLFKHRVKHNEQVQNLSKCDICGEVFQDPRMMETHKLLHHSEVRVYQCNICLETFNEFTSYRHHIRVHNVAGPFVCNVCSQVFARKQAYMEHHYQHEAEQDPSKMSHLRCDKCQKVFGDIHKLRRHVLYHIADKFYKCQICHKGFIERSKLNRHMLTHTGRRDHPCQICGKLFSLKHNLKQHMNIHTGVRAFSCKVCGKAFTQNVVMKRHMKIHVDHDESS